MRYVRELRVRFKGQPALAQQFVAQGRVFVGQLLNMMQLGRLGVGKREVTRPDGVTFRAWWDGGVPILEIDVTRATVTPTLTGLFDGFVVRPSDTSNYGVYGLGSQIVVTVAADPADPEAEILVGRFYAQDFLDGIATDEDVPPSFYGKTYIEGLTKSANMDWRNGDETWVLYLFGPPNRYFGDTVPEWGGDIVYTKGQKLFQLSDLAATPVAVAYPDLVGLDTYLLGACIRRVGDGIFLIVAASTVPGTVLVSSMTDYFVAVPIKPAWPAGKPRGEPQNAPRYEATPSLAYLLAQHDYDGDSGATTMRAIEHPWHFNQDGTEARTLRFLFNETIVDPEDDFITIREVVFHLPDLATASVTETDHVRRDLVIDRSDTTLQGRPDYEVLATHETADEPPVDVTQARNISDSFVHNSGQCINRGDDVAYFSESEVQNAATVAQDSALVPVAVDYKANVAVYAYAPARTGSGTATATGSSTVVEIIRDGSSQHGIESTHERTVVGAWSETLDGITTDAYAIASVGTESTEIDESLTFVVAPNGDGPSNTEDGTITLDRTTVTPSLWVMFLDLRTDWLVFYQKTTTVVTTATRTYAGAATASPTDSASATTTVAHRFGVVRGSTLAYESTFSETPAVSTPSVQFQVLASEFSAGNTLSRTLPGDTPPTYTIPGTYDGTPTVAISGLCDDEVPANPGSGPVAWSDDTAYTSSEPQTSSVPADFLNKNNVDWGWMQPQALVDGPEDRPYYDSSTIKSVGSWVSYGDHWLLSMPWPQSLGVANFLNASSVGSIADACGNPTYGERFYPIWVLPPTQLLD